MRYALTFAIVGILAVVAWTFRTYSKMSPFETAAAAHLEKLLPSEATASVLKCTHTDWMSTAEWQIEPHLSWEEYKRWSIRQVDDGYRKLFESETQFELRDTQNSEIHDLKFRFEPGKRQIHVQYSVSAW